MTLLRTFDPCFDKTEKEAVIEEQDEKNDDSDHDDEKNHSEYDEADNLYAKIDELKASTPSPKNVDTPRSIDNSPSNSSPKKANIGPPKPPRSFNHPTTPEKEPEEKSSPARRGLKSMISEGNLFRRSPRGDEKPSTDSAAAEGSESGSENIYVTAPVWNIADAISDLSSDALSGKISVSMMDPYHWLRQELKE